MTTSEEKTYTHESYGMVGFHRICGGGGINLFGSPLTDNPSRIMMRVHTCTRVHSLGRDWYHADKEVIEIEMSNVQFADLITTLNIGDGVPCTLRRIQGKKIANPPDVETESEAVRVNFGHDLEQLKTNIRSLTKSAQEILGVKGNVTAASKAELLGKITQICQEITANLPFVLESFQEAVEKTTSAAKTEVAAFAMNIAALTGLEQLKALAERENSSLKLESKVT